MRRILACAVVLALAACSSGKPSAKRSTSSVSSPSSVASVSLPTIPVITPLPSSPTPSDAASRRATDALLSTTQLPGFQEIAWSASPIPQPCSAAGTEPVLAQVVPKTLVGRQFSLASPEGVLSEQIAVFAAALDATTASDLAIGGLNCIDGHFYQPDGSTQAVTVAGPADLRSIVGDDASSASSWTMQNGELTATLLLVVDQRVLIILSFVAPVHSDLSKLPDGRTIAQLALANVRTSGIAGAPITSSSRTSASSRH